MAFVTLMSYAANAAMLEREGVDAASRGRHGPPPRRGAGGPRGRGRADGGPERWRVRIEPDGDAGDVAELLDSRRPYLDAIGASRASSRTSASMFWTGPARAVLTGAPARRASVRAAL